MTQSLTLQEFQSALATMNQAIEENREALFFRTLLKACETKYDGEHLGVAIYRDDPQSPHDYYTIRMQDGKLVLVDHGKQQTNSDWSVSEDYIRDLAENPDKFIDHPEKLSLNWLAERVTATVKSN